MDLYLPVLNGAKSTEKIIEFFHEHSEPMMPYFALLTNGDVEKLRQKMLMKGFDKVIKKPIFKLGVHQLLIDSKIL